MEDESVGTVVIGEETRHHESTSRSEECKQDNLAE